MRTHPITGRRGLFVSRSFTESIDDMDPDEGARLLDHLICETHRVEHQMRFRWRVNSLAMWDNRCTQHAPVYDYGPHRRRVERFSSDVASSHDTAIRALRIEGPHVCSLLSAEAGVHLSITSNGSAQVKVQFTDLAQRPLPNPLDVQQTFSSQRCRILYHNRHIVHDPVLAINYPLEPRLHRPYLRFMRAHIYHQLFGPSAHRVFKR